jgi:two-component system chemotaxis response regulator CheB
VTQAIDTAVSVPAPPVGVVVLAASAGGLAALTRVLAALPEDFPAPLVVVQHLDPRHRSLMAEILGRRVPLPVKQAETGDRLAPGQVYVAPPDRHLLIGPEGVLSLTDSERVHWVRPSADLLFESAAVYFGPRAVAVVLSGTGRDGDEGVRAVKRAGGTVLVQDHATSEFFGMPAAAIATGSVDLVLPLGEIAPALVALAAKARTP